MSHQASTAAAFATALMAATAIPSLGLSAPEDGKANTATVSHGPWAAKPPKIVLISLDGAKPDFIQDYLHSGVLPWNGGFGRLSRAGTVAVQNVTATPSLTAVSHIAIATGSTAVHNDIPSNTFHPVAGPISASLSGFAAPIGGYQINPLGVDPTPTAEPLWVRLRAAGMKVVAATWPGADGADIKITNVLVQPATPIRVADYAVPFGAFGGLGGTGFSLNAASFSPDPAVAGALAAAGHSSFSPVLATTSPFETFYCASATTATCSATTVLDLKFEMRAAALDTTNDGATNYDTLAFFEKTQGIHAGQFTPPSTGPAYAKAGGASAKFFFEGSGNKVGAAYFVSSLAPDLSTVRFARYSANFIPRNAPVIAAVDDINNNVGFWAPQDDFRFPERINPGLASFPDTELEAIFEDQVKTFVAYQTAIATRAIVKNPGADLVMVYIEEPDGSEHQFLLTDRRQASNPTDANSIGHNQDAAKVARYRNHVAFAYQQADRAVDAIVDETGARSDVFVVSDHGFAPFHTAVSLANLLKNAGIDLSQVAIRTSGPAAHIYVNLQGREAGGTVDVATYRTLVPKIAAALRDVQDANPSFNYSLDHRRIFPAVFSRPLNCSAGTGFCTNSDIAQDSGDVFAMLAEGYNFDGIQNPGVARRGDPAFNAATTVLSVPNFYGAHGHDPDLRSMSATFIAAGPDIRRATVKRVSNIDVAPTILHLLGVRPARTVDGRALHEVLR